MTLSTSNAPLRSGQHVRLTARPEGVANYSRTRWSAFAQPPHLGGRPSNCDRLNTIVSGPCSYGTDRVTFATGLFLGSIFGACLGFVALAVLRLRKSRNDKSTPTPTV